MGDYKDSGQLLCSKQQAVLREEINKLSLAKQPIKLLMFSQT
jgi:hypothetical protein